MDLETLELTKKRKQELVDIHNTTNSEKKKEACRELIAFLNNKIYEHEKTKNNKKKKNFFNIIKKN